MSTKAEALRTAIAVLTAQLAVEEGKGPQTYLGQILPAFDTDEAERKRLAEIAESMKPHAYVEWAPGVLPELAGTNEKASRSRDTHRALWEAAQRGDPLHEGGSRVMTKGVFGWPDMDGEAFRIDKFARKGSQAVHSAIVWLWFESPEAQVWKRSPAVQNLIPKSAPEF